MPRLTPPPAPLALDEQARLDAFRARVRQAFDLRATEAAGAPPPRAVVKACYVAVLAAWGTLGDRLASQAYHAERDAYEAATTLCGASGEHLGICRCTRHREGGI